MMTTESPYQRVQFDRLALSVNPGQRKEVMAALDAAPCKGRWEAHGGVSKFDDKPGSSEVSSVGMWTFYAASTEDAQRGQLQLDLMP